MTSYRINRWAVSGLVRRDDRSKSAVGRAAHVAPSTITDIESGRRDASERVLVRLAEGLDVDPRALRCDPYAVIPPMTAVVDAARELLPHLNGHDFGLRRRIEELDRYLEEVTPSR